MEQADIDATARREEELYVHSVYENIADHFSRTRYKPWPGISDFFDSLPKGSLGVDAGCGNGKYLGLRSALGSTKPECDAAEATASPMDTTIAVNGRGKGKGKGRARPQTDTPQQADTSLHSDRGLLTLGLDRSSGLIGIAKERGHEVLVGDAIDMPWREGAFDFAISIATIHHFTTRDRRIESIRTMLSALNLHHGKLFIQVWALEQDPALLPLEVLSDHASSSLRHRPKPNVKKPRQMDKLERATLESVAQGDELDGAKQDVFVPWKLQSSATPDTPQDGTTAAPTYQRYYHLFRAGELKELVEAAAAASSTQGTRLMVDEERWEEGNWWITARYGAP